MKIRWGFLGAGWIATTALAPAVHAAANATLQAVASRNPNRSMALAPITVHNSYDELIADPRIDVIYISLANHQHCEWSIKAINAGKHVLCEKPFAINSDEAQQMATAALVNDRILVEAIWNRWHPRFARMVQLVKSGSIGELQTIESAFSFPGTLASNYRLNPEMGGGSLFDVGPYQIHPWAALAGVDVKFNISSLVQNIGSTGVDLTTQVSGVLNNNITVNALASFEREEAQKLLISGSLATIEFVGQEAFTSWKSQSTLRINDSLEEFAPVDPYQLMVEGMGARLNGAQSWLPPLRESIRVMQILDQVRLAAV